MIGENSHQTGFRAAVLQYTLNGQHAADQHGNAVGHSNLMLGCNVHHLAQHLTQMQILQIAAAVAVHKNADILVQLIVIDLGFQNPQRHDGVFQLINILAGNGQHGRSENLAVSAGQHTHHAKIEPDNFSAADHNVPLMRIGMEKAVVQNLFDVVLRQLFTNLSQRVASRTQLIQMIDRNTGNILHDQNRGCA